MEYAAPSLDDILNYSMVCKAFKNVLCEAPLHFQCTIYVHNKKHRFRPDEFWTHLIKIYNKKKKLRKIITNYIRGFRKFKYQMGLSEESYTILDPLVQFFEKMPNSFDELEIWIISPTYTSGNGRKFIDDFVNNNHSSLKCIKKLQHIPTPAYELKNLRKVEFTLARKCCNRIIEPLQEFIKFITPGTEIRLSGFREMLREEKNKLIQFIFKEYSKEIIETDMKFECKSADIIVIRDNHLHNLLPKNITSPKVVILRAWDVNCNVSVSEVQNCFFTYLFITPDTEIFWWPEDPDAAYYNETVTDEFIELFAEDEHERTEWLNFFEKLKSIGIEIKPIEFFNRTSFYQSFMKKNKVSFVIALENK